MLVDVAAAIATGQQCPVSSAAEEDAETEKRLVGAVIDCYPIISIDNISKELGGDFLCQATERTLVRVRKFGKLDNFDIQVKSFLVGTGNNARVKGDMVRRTLLCHLDAQVERPELRAFEFDPVERVLEDRGRYIAAVLTIVRAYLLANKPECLTPIGSYRSWSDLVRSPLVWLGEADPVTAMENARDNDPELETMIEVMDAWRATLGIDHPFTASELAHEACPDPHSFNRPALHDALLKIAGSGSTINIRALGRWLAGHAARPVGGWQITKSNTAHGGVWRYRVSAAPASGGFGGFGGSLSLPTARTEKSHQTKGGRSPLNGHTSEFGEISSAQKRDWKSTHQTHQTHPTTGDNPGGRISL
jgi:hypothetical protein